MPVVAVVVAVVTLTGCGTLSRALRADATPVVAVASATSPVLSVAPVPDSSEYPLGVEAPEPEPANAPVAASLESAVIDPAAYPLGPDAPVEPVPTSDERAMAPSSAEPVTVAASGAVDADAPPVLVAQATRKAEPEDEYDLEEYDPWEPFNEAMFEFNRKLDRYILKPVAKTYDKVVPDEVQRMIANAIDNLGFAKRLVNSLLQGKWDGAAREWSRFLINSTMGIGGFWDVAKLDAKIEKSREDFGQTLGFYGAGPGPYLQLPLLEPMTVRDGIGRGVDGFLDPIGYGLPLIWEALGLKVVDIVNERSLNLELFQGFEETVIDMYSAVRHAYLQRRRNLIKE